MATRYPLGTTRIPRSRAERLTSFLRGLGWTIAALSIAAGMFAFAQAIWHPFDLVIEKADANLAVVDQTLSKDAMGGISIGSFALVAVIAAVPLFRKGVRRGQYALSFWRGLLSSAIFLASDKLYRIVLAKGAFYFSATMLLFLAVTIILVEIVSRAGKVEKESDTRTELLASIVSGLVFGLLVQFGEYAISLIPRLLGSL
ncbi:MAG: hypothetical protein WCL50_08045 [Spirochaetota bacterium]